MAKNTVPVVITRKHKKLGLGAALAFTLTGGLAAPFTMAKGASNIAYNAQTERLQREYEESQAEESQAPAAPQPGVIRVYDADGTEWAGVKIANRWNGKSRLRVIDPGTSRWRVGQLVDVRLTMLTGGKGGMVT
jgi:hypothetical protein